MKWKNKGKQKTSVVTINGPLEFERSVFWSKGLVTVSPLDILLGIVDDRYSTGVREMACRLGLNEAFVNASDMLARTAQLSIKHSALRELIEREGMRAQRSVDSGQFGPDWTSADCTDQTVITGSDGVMIPLVEDTQKAKRRVTEKATRQSKGLAGRSKRGRPKSGSDGPYKEAKIVSFYDPDKSHKYAIGTGGNHEELGKLMRREACKIRIDQAEVKYSIADGADWIYRQYSIQLPMLDVNILDYYHLKEHVVLASRVLYGEGTRQAHAWRDEMMEYVWTQGSLVMLDKLGNYIRRHQAGPKREALDSLLGYVAKRVEMTDYPSFRERGYDCGSGPTESFCGCLTKRLKGRGMKWDKDNALSIMALGSLYYSNLWTHYWIKQTAA